MRRTGRIALCAVLGAAHPVAGQQPVLIEGATIVSPHLAGPLTNTSILTLDGRIEAIGPAGEIIVPPEVERIDARGKWVIPGLIDYHTHYGSELRRARALGLGVTTVQQIGGADGSPIELEQRSRLPDEPTPRLHILSGRIGEFMGRPHPMSVEEAEAEVERIRFSGVRVLKIWQDDGVLWLPPDDTFPPIPDDAFRALVSRSHELGMEVAVHAWKLDLFSGAIAAGVDRVIHPVADEAVPDEVWQRMNRDGLVWATTMTVFLDYADRAQRARRLLADPRLVRAFSETEIEGYESALDRTDYPVYERWSSMRENRERYMRTIVENTRSALRNGVTIVIGSDSAAGTGTHAEIGFLVEAGLEPETILRAATINGARALGIDRELGSLEVGKTADLVILGSDPLADATNLRDTFLVMKGGHVFRPDELFPSGD